MAGALTVTRKRTKAVQPGNEVVALGGGLEGADRLARETMQWDATRLTPDRIINGVKEMADARGRDSQRNDGYIQGATQVHKDSIVGAQFRLNAQPDADALAAITGRKGFDEVWEEEFQTVVEARFNLLADSEAHWLDCERTKTLTGIVRLGIGVFLGTGEFIATGEWIRESDRPYNTAIQMIRSDRLCNPSGQEQDTRFLRRGVVKDLRGKPAGYWFRSGEKLDMYNDKLAYTWQFVPATKPWGRKQVIHIIDQQDHGQTRGVSEMVAVLKNIRMTKRYSDIVLQQAVVNATYAAAIESELPGEVVAAMLGKGTSPMADMNNVYGGYMNALQSYLQGSKNIAVDGAMIPHLFPGTKMKMMNAGTPGGIGTEFEASLLRKLAAGLGISYESLSRDFSKTNYSSGRLSMGVQAAAMASRKRAVADAIANNIYQLQLEEMMSAGDVPLPAGVRRNVFYQPLAKEAFCTASWIGSGAGQVDELKETQAAMLRIASGLSTHEIENARLGQDWRKTAKQAGREQKFFATVGFVPNYGTIKPNGVGSTDPAADGAANDTPADTNAKGDN